MILVNGVWIRHIGGKVQLLVDLGGTPADWRLVAEEPIDAAFSHIVEPGGIARSPVDPIGTVADPIF